MKLKVPQLLWHGNTEMDLSFPETWSVSLCSMKGKSRPPLAEEEIAAAFASPIGTKPLEESARGKNQIAILFDDLARPTPVSQLVPYVVKALEKAGVSDSGVRLIAALGAHGAHTAADFRKKLGDEVLERFPVYNHNPFGSCTYLGTTSQGTPVSINSEVMACDLKIGIGCITPHVFTGFGGGGKIILPGVSSMETMAHNHGPLLKAHPECLGLGRIEGNAVRRDIDEACRMAGLDFKIDAVINLKAEITGLFAGDPILGHRAGVELAKEVYATPPAMDMDVVVVNAYGKSNECAIVPSIGLPALKEQGGDLVIIANEPSGQIVHYLYGEFGRCGEEALPAPVPSASKARRCILLSPIKDIVGAACFRGLPSLIWAKTWQEVLDLLTAEWGDRANVAIYPDATVQYVPSD
ncbi:MAG: lactate racemase domain-containing protein [Thermodesulfobacteriota bacterium]